MNSTRNENAPAAATAKASNVNTNHTNEGNYTMSIAHNGINSTSLPVIAGVEITTDAEGRFNLNALHKASGLGKSKQPANWMRLDSTKELIAELGQSSDLRTAPIDTVVGSASPGTFAHEILAVSYAAWISPAFQIQVNQVFIAYRTGRLEVKQPKREQASKSYLPEFRKAKAMKMATEAMELCLKYTTLSPESKQVCVAKVVNDIAGFEAIPLPLIEEKHYTATEVGEMLGCSANKIGKIANQHNLKTEQYGKVFLDKSPFSSKQVETFRYNANGVSALKQIVIGEDAA